MKRPFAYRSSHKQRPVVVLTGEQVVEAVTSGREQLVTVSRVDGHVFTSLVRDGGPSVWAVLRPPSVAPGNDPPSTDAVVEADIRGISSQGYLRRQDTVCIAGRTYEVSAVVRGTQRTRSARVQIAPLKEDLFSRSRGLIETSALFTKNVVILALGTVGGTVAKLLAQSGIGRFMLMDPERVEVGNVERHEAGLADVGRLKTDVLRDIILGKNPHAQVYTCPDKLMPSNEDQFREVCRWSDLIIVSADDRICKLFANRVAYEEGTSVIFAGCYRRAYGGMVIRVRPGLSGCYHCHISGIPSSGYIFEPMPDAHGIEYTDIPVPIEAGLAVDVAPINHLAAKLALQELMQDVPTTFRSLDEDLNQDIYMWLNRREVGTEYEHLDPLQNSVDGLKILRWYGANLMSKPDCPVCGHGKQRVGVSEAVTATRDEIEAFETRFYAEEAQ